MYLYSLSSISFDANLFNFPLQESGVGSPPPGGVRGTKDACGTPIRKYIRIKEKKRKKRERSEA
jgi:hypothetical protein